MITKLLNFFQLFKTEQQSLEFFKSSGTYIPPKEISIGVKEAYITNNSTVTLGKKDVTIQFIPLRSVFQKFVQQPDVFNNTLSYINHLEQNNELITNVIQGEA